MKRLSILFLFGLSLVSFGCDDASNDDCHCTSNQICKNGSCVNNTMPDEGNNTTPGEGNNTSTVEVACQGITCNEGVCDEGVCVTNAMKQYQTDDFCDPETFVDFCNGDTAVYCDNGIVIVADNPCEKDRCVIYMDTTLSRPRKKATCSEGSCTNLGAIETSCENIKGVGNVVFAKACLMTTRNTMETVYIDGYYCMGSCNSSKTKCELVEGECHPYETTSKCDGQRLETCYMNSELHAIARNEFCPKACIQVGGKDMCGLATCQSEGERKNICGYADSMNDKDSLDTICVQADNEMYYQVRTGLYEVCDKSCNRTTGECE